MDRHCRFCGKVLSLYQTKFCCREHWLEYEEENTKTGRLSGSKKTLLENRKVMRCTNE